RSRRCGAGSCRAGRLTSLKVLCRGRWMPCLRCHLLVQNVFESKAYAQVLAEHGDEAVQCLGGDLLVLNERDANVALAGVAAVRAVAREVVAGNDAKPAVAPEFHGCGLVTALLAHIEPEEEAAGRALVAVAAADDLVGKIELRDIELAVLLDVGFVAVSRDCDLLRRHRHLWRRDVAQLDVAAEEAAIAG